MRNINISRALKHYLICCCNYNDNELLILKLLMYDRSMRMFSEKSSTEVITIDKEIKVVGLSLQKSSLPLSFESLEKLWSFYGEKYRGKVKNAIDPVVEYAVCLNKVPDYITGCSVTDIEDMEEGWNSYIIKQGKYIKDTFNAETFYQLTTEIMGKRNVNAWAKANNIKINKEYSIEVYPIEAIENQKVEMYTLTPIKD